MQNQIQIPPTTEAADNQTEKPKKPVCELFERQPDRPPVWCNNCGRHKQLHSSVLEDDGEETDAPRPFNRRDPFGCADQDTFNAIYRGGNSSPFPYEQEF